MFAFISYFFLLFQKQSYFLYSSWMYNLLSVYITKIVRSNSAHGEEYSIQHYVIKFVSDLQQVDGILRVLRFPPPIKMAATILFKYC